MNANCYKTVFSKRLGALVAVGEHAASQGKATGSFAGAGFTYDISNGISYYLAPLILSFALVSMVWAAPANTALPTGGQVAQGAAAISQSGANMAIQQSTARAVVNWQSFDIGKDAKVNIVQPNAQAVLLNRVTGAAPSQIFGQMTANGQVVLVNPNGVTFGKDGSVSAAGLTASTLNTTDADFMAGRNRFTRDGATGQVLNQGTLTSAPGGYVALLGASVSNEGKIVAPQGHVALGAAETITMPLYGSSRIKLELTPSAVNAAVANQKGGTIVTEGGQVYMQAAAVGSAMASVMQSGSIDTTGAQGGAVHLLADGGRIKVDGSITANSTAAGNKGGDILIGRDADTGVLAKSTDVSGANLESKRGFVETSGDYLKADAISVKADEWLLDPTNITIAASGASGTAYANTYTAAADSVILASDINNSLNQGTSVTIATSVTGASAGHIAINESIAKTAGGASSLTLRAHGDITLATGKTITSTAGNLNVTLNSDFDGNGSGAIVMNTGSGITSLGGNIALGGGTAGNGSGFAMGNSTNPAGISLVGATLKAGGGNITMNGKGYTSSTVAAKGIVLTSSSAVSTTGGGNITLNGQGGTSVLSVGVSVESASVITGSSTGSVSLTGTGGTSGLYNFGVWINGSGSKVTTTGGSLTVTGTGGGSANSSSQSGVMIQNAGSLGATGAGTVTVTGTGGNTTGSGNNGVEINYGSITSETGAINVTGVNVSTASPGYGITLGAGTTSGKIISSGNAAIRLTTDSFNSTNSSDSVNAGTGTVTIQQRTGSTTLNVGGTGTDTLSGTLQLDVSAAELGKITASKTVVGLLAGSGTVTVNALNMGTMGNTGGDLSVLSGSHIAVNGSVTKTAGTDATLSLLANGDIAVASNTNITGSSGKLNVLFNSDSNGNSAGGIVFNTGSGVTSNGGDITLGGGTAGTGAGSAFGSSTAAPTTAAATTSSAGITLNGAAISAGGGHIKMTGTSNASNGSGINATSSSSIVTSGSGAITLSGTSRASGSTSSLNGVGLLSTTVTGGSGGVTIVGNASAATTSGTYTYGVMVKNGTVSTLNGGNINITGSGGGGLATTNYGFSLDGSGAVSASGAGHISITGVAGTNAAAGININEGTGGVKSTTGNITFTADSVNIAGAINSGAATTTIQNYTAGTLINVGGADVVTVSPKTLGVTNAEMNLVTAGTLKIGSTTTGAMTTSAAVTTAATTGNVYLQSGSSLTTSRAINSGASLLLQTTGGVITTNAALSGTNVSVDNTTGTINWATGALTAGANSGSSNNAVNMASSITATGNVNILGNVATTNTGVNLTSAGSITSSGTAATINIKSNYSIVNAAAIKATGATGTGSNINLTATGGGITGAGAIGDTTHKNANVTMTTGTASTFSGAVNAANFTKEGVGALTLDSWAQATPATTNVSNAYNVNAGSLYVSTGNSYYTLNPTYVNINNATTFGQSGVGNSTWAGTNFVFDSAGGGTVAWGAGTNPIMNVGTAPLTFKTNGGATNNITGYFNMGQGSGVTFDVAPASTATNPGLLLSSASNGNGFANATNANLVVTKTGTGLLRATNTFSAPTLNVNQGTWEFGDGTTARGVTALSTGWTTMNIGIASGATLSYNTPSGQTMDSTSTKYTGAGTLLKKGAGTVRWNTTAGTFAMSAGALIDVQSGTFVGGSWGNEVWAGNKSSLNVASGAIFLGVESSVEVDALTGAGTIQLGFNNTGGMTVGVNGTAAGSSNNATGTAYNAAGTATFSGTFSGGSTSGGFLTKTGTGTQILTGNNSYAGATTVSAGTLKVGNGGATGTLGSGAVTVNSPALLDINRTGAYSLSTVASNTAGITGTGNVLLTGNAPITVDRNIALTGSLSTLNATSTAGATTDSFIFGNTTLSANTLNFTGTGSGKLNGGATATIGLAGGTANLNFTSSSIYGFYGFEDATTLNTVGTVNIKGTYTGTSNIYGGVGLGGTVTNTGGQLTVLADASSSSGRVGFENGYTGKYAGNLKVSGNVAIIGTAGSTFSAGMRDIAIGAITATGNSTLSLTGNKYGVNFGSGVTETSGKVLNLNVTNAGSTGIVHLNGGALSISGALALNSANNIYVTKALRAAGGISVNAANTSAITGVISGAGSLTKSGAGTLALTQDNTYTGGTNISAGTLNAGTSVSYTDGLNAPVTLGSAGSTGSVGTGAVTLSNNANLSFTRSAATTIANSISGVGNVSASITGAASTLTVSGPVNLTGGTVNLAADNNISVTAPMATTNATSSAVVINAGKSTNAGTSTGGNLLFSGSGAVSVGAGGRATLMSGSVAGSTGLTALVGSGSGNFRYNSDESTTNYTTALGSGLYGIYRESPNVAIQVNNQSRTYDASSYSGHNGYTATGLVNGDTTAGTLTAGGTSQGAKNAGSYTLTASALSGLGYTMASSTAGTLTIHKKDVTLVSISAANKTYDATTAATITTGSINGTVGTETLTVSGIGTFSDKNAANNKTVTVADVTTLSKINGTGDWANYNLTSTGAKTTTASISRKNLTALATANDKVYNGSATATVVGSSSELIGSDSVGFAYSSAVFSDKNVSRDGSGNVINKAVTVSGLDLTGTDAGNYALQNTAASSSAKITPAALNVSATANNKTYDGSRSATAATSASNVMAGDTVVVSNTGALFDTKQAGTGKTVTVAGLALSGSDSGNYALQSTTATTTANIDKKAITLTGITAANKTYDGGTAATVSTSSASFNDKVAGDDLSVASTGLFIDKNAATDKTVNLTHTLGGADIGNYSVTAQPTTTADIARKNLTAVATANDKVYDGSTTATAVGSSSDIIGADSVGFAYSGAAFSDKNVSRNGSGNVVNKTVTVSGLSLTGMDAGNYALQNPTASTVAQITPAALTVTAIESNKTYDGSFNAVGTATVGSLATANDSVNTAAAQTYLDQNAGNNKTVRASGLTLKDASNADMTDNYTITYVDNTTSSIAKANLTVAANSDARFVVQTDAAGYNGVSYSGFVAGETSSVLGGSVSISRSNAATQAAGHYSGALVASGLTAANYNISYANGDYTIVAANQLLVRTTNTTTTYGSTPTYTTTAQYLDGSSNQIASLTPTVSGNNYTFSDGVGGSISMQLKPYTGSSAAAVSNSGNTIVGNYDIKDTSPTVVGSNFVGSPVFVGALTVNSKAVSPTVTGVSKVYDGSTTMNNLVLGMDGKVTGDSLSISGTGAFNQKNVGQNLGYTVSGISLNGGDASNYYLSMVGSGIAGTNGSITPAALVLTSADVSKVYDRSTSANGVAKATQSTQLFGSDSLTGGTFAFTDKNAGGNKTVKTSGVTINDGNNGANYTVSYVDNTTSSITAKNLTVSYSAASKTYDGSRTATVTASSADLISGDTVSFNHSSALFDNKQAQAGKTVTVAGIELSGSDAGNYALQSTTATTTANIDKKVITLTGITAANKTYDGGTAATVSTSSASFNDKVANDDLSVVSTGSFSDKNAAAGKTVNLTNTLGGADLGNYTITQQTATTANIAKKDVTLGSITAADKTYDGNDTASITAGSISTGVGLETLAVSGSGTFSDKNAATGKTVTVADVTALTKTNGTGDWSNYNLTSTGSATTTANIAKKDVTLASITAAGKTYDGNDTASITAGSITTGVGSETLAISGSGTFSDKNAATGKTVTVADVTALTKTNGTGDWSNYNLTSTGSATTTADIAKKDVTLASITAAGKTYDGNDTASITAGAISTGVDSETLAVSGSGTFSDKNAATGKTVTVADVTALTKTNGTGDWNNYNLTSTGSATTTANIAKKDVTLVSITAAGKTYDGNDTASITSGAISTGVGSETLAVSGSGTFSDKNAATGKTVTVADVTALTKTNGTGDWSNYNLTSTGSATTTADIAKKDVTLASITAAGKTYDGNDTASITAGAISTGVGSETLAVSGSGTFSDKNADTGKTVTVADVTALTKTNGTGDWNNYNLTSTGSATTTADIDKKTITLTGITAANKTYDGGTAATVSSSSASFNDKVAGDDLSVVSTGSFSDKNAATSKTVSLTHTLGGADIGNYSVTAQDTTTANIDKKAITLTGITAANKTYDGGTAATVSTSSASFNDKVAGDDLSVASTGLFIDKNAATDKTVNLTHTLGGADIGNYSVTAQPTTTADIARKNLTAVATANDKVYDGSTTATAVGSSSDIIGADSVGFAYSGAAFSDKNVSRNGSGNVVNKTVTVSGLSLTGMDAGNYALQNPTASTVAQITPAALTVTAIESNKTYDGSFNAVGTATVGSLATANDSVNTAAAQTYLDQNAGTFKTVRASGLTLKDASNADMTDNYTITYVDNTTSSIAKANLTVAANSDARFVVQTDAAGYNGVSYSGFVAGETSSVLGGSVSISRSNAATQAAGHYSGALVASGLTAANYNISYANGDYTIVAANQLLVRTTNTTTTYGSTPTYTTTAQYLDGSSNQIASLTPTVSGNNYTFSDGVGGSISMQLKPYTGSSAAAVSNSGNTIVGNYDIKDTSPTVVGSNFVGSPVFVGALTVNSKAVSPTVTGVSKVYDGSTTMNNLVLGMDGKVTGDSLSISGTGAFNQKNVGQNLGYTVSGISLNGGDASNYYLSMVGSGIAGTNGSITPAALVLTSADVSKVYDRSTSANGVAKATQSTQLFGSDSLTGGTFAFTDKNAGGNKTVKTSGVTINDGNNGANYTVSYVDNTTSSITAKNLTVSYSAASKTYDGSRTAAVTASSADLISGDIVSFNKTSANFSDKNVDTNKTVTVTGLSINGNDAGNYNLTNTSATTTAAISQARLQEVNAAKTYDGQSTVTGNQLTLIKGVGNETFTAAATDTASITGKDVTTANNKVTSTSGLNLTGTAEGTLASNYDLTATPVASAVTIAQKEVVLSAAKTYDGNKNLSAAQLSITTGVGSETLSSSGATINSKNVADNSTNFVDAVTLVDGSGVNAGLASNYKAPTLTVRDGDKNTVSISKATLALTLANQTKVYDGTDTAAIKAGDVTATGVTVGSNTESASFKAVTGAYNSKNVASANATSATVSSTNVDTTAHGLDLNNYTLSTTGVTQTASNNTSAISKATLALALADQTKVYDGTVTASIKAGDVTATGVTVGTSTESISFKAVTGAFNSKNVASASSSSATVSSTSVDTATAAHGMDLSNYTLSTTGVTQIASNNASTISKANLNVAAQTVTKVYDGTTAATGTGTVGTLAGQAAGESVNSAGTQTFTDKNFGMGNKTVKASGVTIKDGSGADVTGNYNVAYSDNTASTINKADLSVTAQAVTKVYDGTTAATGTGTVGALAGQAAGESVNSAGTQTFTDKNFGVGNKTVKASGVTIKDSSGADVTGNYNVAYTDNTASTINKAKLTVTLADQSKTYDGTTAATLVPSAFTVKGVTVAGQTETASVNQTAALYNDKNVLGASSVTAILVAGNFAGATGTDLNNYILPTSVTANGSITPKVAAVTGTATTMQANGTLQTQLPATKSGFVAGEDVTVSGLATGMIAGTYNSNLSAAPANAATVLSNYNMAYTNATLKITPAIVTNSTVAVALARTPTPSSRLNLLGFSNTSAQGAAVAGNVYSGDDSKGLPSAKGLSPQTCSPENLQQCECQEGGDNGIEMCTATDSKF